MFDASIAPSAAPAPMTVCSSSMKRMMEFFARRISSMIFFRRCSNSPRYLVPATTAAKSRVITRLLSRISGMSPRGDLLRQAFDDGGLAHAGIADQNRDCSSCGGTESGSCARSRRRGR